MRLLVLMMKLAGWGEIKLWGGFRREWGGHRIQDIEGSITHERFIGCEANIDSDVTNVTVLVTKSKNEPVSTGMSRIPVSDVAFPHPLPNHTNIGVHDNAKHCSGEATIDELHVALFATPIRRRYRH